MGVDTFELLVENKGAKGQSNFALASRNLHKCLFGKLVKLPSNESKFSIRSGHAIVKVPWCLTAIVEALWCLTCDCGSTVVPDMRLWKYCGV